MKINGLGVIVSSVAAVIWGYVYVTTEGITDKLSPAASLAASYFWGSIFMIPLFIYYFKDIVGSIYVSPYLFLSGAIAAIVADFAIIWSISLIGGTSAGLIEISYPLWTAIFLFIIQGKYPNLATAIGGFFILVGVFIIGIWGQSR